MQDIIMFSFECIILQKTLKAQCGVKYQNFEKHYKIFLKNVLRHSEKEHKWYYLWDIV